jgi:carbon monoxide dehydrogenase subunit G
MKLTNEFTVPASIEQAWGVLLDLERVAPCLPGARIEGGSGDEHTGTMTIKIGPITARYSGTVRIEEADEAARRAVMRAQAKDARGQGTAAATITSTMQAVPEGTRVQVETDMRVTGPAAQFGRGVMQDVSAKLMGRFADCLAEEMQGDAAVSRPTAGNEAAPADSATTAPYGSTTGAAPTRPGGQEETAVGSLPTGPAGDAAEAAAAGAAQGASATPPPRPRPTEDVLDLGEASRDAVLKRALPVVAALAAAAVVVGLLRRRG